MDQFVTRLQAQGVPQEHYAFRCACCGHIQSAASLVRYLPPEDASNNEYIEKYAQIKNKVKNHRVHTLLKGFDEGLTLW